MAGLLTVGDAAGFIDPMTGDGLRFAFSGAELAAAAAVESGDVSLASARALAARREREFRGKLADESRASRARCVAHGGFVCRRERQGVSPDCASADRTGGRRSVDVAVGD